MAYGTPNSLDEIEPYYTDIRGGRKPSPENLHALIERYKRVGGRTPLLDITLAQAQALQSRLGDNFHVYVGMKHWRPYIAQAVGEIMRDGYRRVIALALAPLYSRFSTDGYIQRVRDAIDRLSAEQNPEGAIQPDVTFVESWNDHPLFLRAVAEKMQAARQGFGVNGWDEIQVIFSAHSLPERILQANDPYPCELEETCAGVAALVGLKRESWRFAYQSAGRTSEKWLGPDILDTLDQIAAEGHRCVLIAPVGFVADHLEVLYDIDVECAELAHALGLEMRRIESPNADPNFIAALAAIVREHSP
jgi:ferrochelatase